MAWSRSVSLSSRKAEISCSMRFAWASSFIAVRFFLTRRLFCVEGCEFIGDQACIIRYQTITVGPQPFEEFSMRSEDRHILHFGKCLHRIDSERTNGNRLNI